jgi:hypothetical protein
VDDNDRTTQGEYPGFSPAAYGAPAVVVSVVQPLAAPYDGSNAPVVAFRPLSTGEVLDRTFSLYKQRFWLFVGIGMVPAGVLLLSSAIRLLILAFTHHTNQLRPTVLATPGLGRMTSSFVVLQLYLLPTMVLFVIAYGIAYAATVDAVNRAGQGTALSVGGVYRAVRGRWLRWCGIVLRQGWSAAWPMLPGVVMLFGSVGLAAAINQKNNLLLAGSVGALGTAVMIAGVVLGTMNFVRNSLAVPAGVSEDIGVNASMRRSRILASGRKGRLFLAWLLVYALQMVVAAVQMPLLFAAMSLRGGAFVAVQTVLMLVQFVAVALVTPVASIAFTLFYIDERVRREGFDIELLMRRTLPGATPVYASEM